MSATAVESITAAELKTLWEIARAAAASRKYENAYSPEEALARILAGRDLGLSPTDALLHMNWLEGAFKPAAQIQGALLKAYVGADGERFDYRAIREDTQCLITILRREQGGEWEEVGDVTFTMDDARRAGLAESSEFWRQYPRRMLFWRALSEAIEAFAPHVVHPVHLPPAIDPGQLDGEGFELPIEVAHPLDHLRVAGEDAHPDHARGWLPTFTQIVNSHEKRGTTGRIVEALDAVGAPAGENLLQRFAGLPDGNTAHEVIHRLGRNRRTRRSDPGGENDGHATG